MRYLTAGESHGPRLTAIIEGIPAGLPLTAEDINEDLKRRQGGYGRGAVSYTHLCSRQAMISWFGSSFTYRIQRL